MSLELVARNAIKLVEFPYTDAFKEQASLWDDDIGLCKMLYYSQNPSPINTGPVYAIAQLDGSANNRNPSIANVEWVGPDLSASNPKYFFQVTDGSSHQWFYEFDPRIGTYKYTNGQKTQYNASPLPLPTGSVWTTFQIVAITVDSFVAFGNAGSSFLSAFILTFPRDPAAPQVWTQRCQIEGTVSSSFPYQGGYVSRSDYPGKVWFNYAQVATNYNGVSMRFQKVVLLDLTTWTISETHVMHDMDDTGAQLYADNNTSFAGWGSVWYSRKFRVFIANFGRGIYVFSQQTVPKKLAAPVITPNSGGAVSGPFSPINPDPGGTTELAITTIKRSNPTIIETATSLSAWMAANGLSNGDKVFIEQMTNYGYENFDRRVMDQYAGSYNVFGQYKIGRATLPITVIDDTHFSVPVDGNVAADVVRCRVLGGHTYDPTNVPTGHCAIQCVDENFIVGDKVELLGFSPSGSSLNGNHTITSTYSFGSTLVIDYDYDTLGAPTSTNGFLRFGWSGVASAPKATTKAIATSFHVGFLGVDLTVSPPVVTVDRADWLDRLGIPANGTFKVSFEGTEFTFQFGTIPSSGFDCTRVAANKFAIAVDPDNFYRRDLIGWEFQSQLHPKIVLNYDLQVGDTLFFKDVPDYPAINGTVAHILSVVTPGDNEYVIDIDTTAMPAWPWNFDDYVVILHPITSISGRVTFKGPGGPGALPPVNYSGKGLATSVLVTDDLNLPAPNVAVTWSSTAGGVFNQTTTMTDKNGMAITTYIAPKTYSGSATITATVNWS